MGQSPEQDAMRVYARVCRGIRAGLWVEETSFITNVIS